MFNELINDIDLSRDKAEFDVSIAICESYNKMLAIIAESDDELIIQESYSLFSEAADDNNDKKSIKDYIVGIVGRICEALKNVIVKIIDIFNRKILKRRESYNVVVNSLMILDAFQHVNVKSVVQESGICEIEFDGVYAEFNKDVIGDNEYFEEKWSPMDELRSRKAERNIEKAKREQNQNIPAEQLQKGLEKFYRVELRHKILSKKDIADIVRVISMTATPEVINELKSQINQFEKNDTIQNMSAEAQGYKDFIVNTVDKKNQAKWKEVCLIRATQCKTVDQAEMELAAMSSLVDNFGKSVSRLTNQRVTGSKVAVMDTLTTDAHKAVYRGFMDLADIIWSTAKQIPVALNALKQNITFTTPAIQAAKQLKTNIDTALTDTGTELREGYEKFQSDYHHSKDLLNDMNQKATKLIATLKFCGDGLGEETIIANQDAINSDVFRPEKVHSASDVTRIIGKMIYGGPVTCVMKILAMLTPGYVAWATAMANGMGLKASTVAGVGAIGANALASVAGIASVDTIGNVFKTLTGTALRGYAVRKLTGDMDAKTPTMKHDEQERAERESHNGDPEPAVS